MGIFAINTWTWPKMCSMCKVSVKTWKDSKCIQDIGICCECADDMESRDEVLLEEMKNSRTWNEKQERYEKHR